MTFAGDRLHVSFADGRSLQLDQYAEVVVTLGSYHRKMQFLVLDTEEDLILGMSWIESVYIHKLDWALQVLTFFTNLRGRSIVFGVLCIQDLH